MNLKSCVVQFIATVRITNADFVTCNLYLSGHLARLALKVIHYLLEYEDVFY